MANNKVFMEVTLSNILARMNPGCKYTVYNLAKKFKVKTEVVRPKVLELSKSGLVRVEHAKRNNYYIKTSVGGQVELNKDEPVVIANSEFAVAAPLIPVDMTSNLKGYEAQFNRFVSLCMTLKRIA